MNKRRRMMDRADELENAGKYDEAEEVRREVARQDAEDYRNAMGSSHGAMVSYVSTSYRLYGRGVR